MSQAGPPDVGRTFLISEFDLKDLTNDRQCRDCEAHGRAGVFTHKRVKALKGGGVSVLYHPCTTCKAECEIPTSQLDGPVSGLNETILRQMCGFMISGTTTYSDTEQLLVNQGSKPFHKTDYGALVKLASYQMAKVLNDGVERLRDEVKKRPTGSFGSWTKLYISSDTGWAKRAKKNRHGDSPFAITVILDHISTGILAYDLTTNLEVPNEGESRSQVSSSPFSSQSVHRSIRRPLWTK